ncbi:choice-of-anchor X domain-containing protein [Rhodoferax sp.]|uniref:choice-of-anchor X domain-containing protein n=1 Tax=Rhodoferax sp. TaxID=50421 RepID=UPI002754808B|nr:choice-of-anchor X domain-containing protein [Rhodoferax sp.]
MRLLNWLLWLAPVVLVIALAAYWLADDTPSAASTPVSAPIMATSPGTVLAGAPATSTASGAQGPAPYSTQGLATRALQLEQWQRRLVRAQESLETYRKTTLYPHESRPISEQPDQVYINQPIVEDQLLRMPGSKNGKGLNLRTTQERVFVVGQESVRFSVSLRDDGGKLLPLRVLRATAKEVPDPGRASLFGETPMNFNDDGTSGDNVAGDGVYSTQLQPATQGFAGLLGQIRVELFLQSGDSQGFVYFDIMYSPDSTATWLPGVRDAVEAGSLHFLLPVQVKTAGRYVVSGRVDDANGKPFALVSFNNDLALGPQQVRLMVFGKLVRDEKPALPLVLRDVEGFLLRADTHPDRILMPRLAGKVHTSKAYPLASFSASDWTSEERERYLTELTKDVNDAKKHVDQLSGSP